MVQANNAKAFGRELIVLIDEEHVKHVILTAEKSLKDCWTKLIQELRRIGLDVEFKKAGGIFISKKHADGALKFVGVDYLYKMIQTHLFNEETIISLVQKSIEKVEDANIKKAAYIGFDYDFAFQ